MRAGDGTTKIMPAALRKRILNEKKDLGHRVTKEEPTGTATMKKL